MTTSRRIFALTLALALAGGLSGCNGDVAARVNGEAIRASEIDRQIDAIKASSPDMFAGVDAESREMDLRQRLLDQMIDQALLRQAAEKEGVEVSEEDLDQAIDETKAGFSSEEEYLSALANAGMTEDDFRDQFRDQMLIDAMLEVIAGDPQATEEEIADYYDENQSQFTEFAAKRPSHILFAPEDKETAEQVLQEIRDGGDFAALAGQHSQDPASAENGGDLGWPQTPYVEEFEAALAELEVGEVSDLVETVFGWHIITVTEEREESVRTLDEARAEIEAILVQQKRAEAFQQYLDDLRAEAEIEYLVDYSAAPAQEDS